jgi:hypothetical protein
MMDWKVITTALLLGRVWSKRLYLGIFYYLLHNLIYNLNSSALSKIGKKVLHIDKVWILHSFEMKESSNYRMISMVD